MKHNSIPNRFLKSFENKKNLLLLLFVLTYSVLNSVYAQNNLSPEELNILKEAYSKIKNPEISLESFIQIQSHLYGNGSNKRTSAANSSARVQDIYCSKVRALCTNGDFETGLDQNQWTGAYGFDFTGIYPDPFSLTYGFSSGALNSSAAHQTIVDKSSRNDPTVGIPLVAANGGNKSLRLGNSVTGNGTEVLAKTIVVDPNETILSFYYAVVFQDPGHAFNDQPAFSVRAYDCATGLELSNVCDLGNGSNVVVSNALNPFFKSAAFGSIAYRDWSLAQINLSAHVGKTVILIFENKDCNLGGHYGYTYLDNIFSNLCPVGGPVLTGQGSVTLNQSTTSTCGIGQICVNHIVPSSNNATGSVAISLDIYQSGIKITTLNSPTLTTNSSYCFNIDPSALGLNSSLSGFDYSITGRFTLSGFSLAPITVGSPPNGQVSGANNDYLIICPIANVYYSKSTGDLHNVLTWGVNLDGSGANPPDFGAGKTFNLANRVINYTMTADWTVGGLIVNPSGGQLQINGFTLSESGISGAGTITGSPTSNLIVTGSTPHTLNFTLGNINFRTLNNLTLNRSASGDVVALGFGEPLNILNVLSVNTGTLTTNNSLTLKSTATNTARVAPITATGIVSGNVTVERYIPARRAWRLLAAPVGGTQSINAAWQEGTTTFSGNPNPNPGFGTHITQSVSGGADGLDFNTATAMASLKKHDNPTNTWVPVLNTNSTAVNSNAWFIFVRGDRSINMGYNTVAPNNTTLRSNGALKVGDQNFSIAATGLTAVPNPYASPINFASIAANNPNINNSFTVVDPKLGSTGAFVNVSFNGVSYDVTPAAVSPITELIQSGQGFLVQSKGVAGTIVIREVDKSATLAANVFRVAENTSTGFVANNTSTGLRINLQTTISDTAQLLDEVFSSYSNNYSNNVDNIDVLKATNPEENLAIVTQDKTIMVDRRKYVSAGDVIQLKLWNTLERNYILEINPVNLTSLKVSAFLEDSYLKTSTLIDLNKGAKIPFNVTSDVVSKNPYRFKVVFSNTKAILESIFTSGKAEIQAVPNPTVNKSLGVQLINQPQGLYNVELTDNLGRVIYRTNVAHAGGTVRHTVLLDGKVAKGLYNLKVIQGGTVKTMKVLIY